MGGAKARGIWVTSAGFFAAFLWMHACLGFYITAGVTSSLVLCWRVLLKPLTSLFNKICLNAASTPRRLQKSPGRVEEIMCWRAGRNTRPSEDFLLNGAKINKLRTVDTNSPN